MAKEYKSGEIVPESGIYGIYFDGEKQTEATCVEGERFPATQRSGSVFRLVRKTKHNT